MQSAHELDQEQSTYWNGAGGQAWSELQTVLDRTLAPFADLLVQGTPNDSIDRVLDIGCGAGATTFAAARLLRADGHCVGIDISAPLIAAAQTHARREHRPVSFICADAATYAFEPDAFDLLISRFGLMFFGEPAAAFENLRRAAKPNATLRFLAWRSPAENAFMTAAECAARPFLPNLPDRQPDAPGQFAFADSKRIAAILVESGWTEIDIRPIDIECSFPATELTHYFTKLGPLGRVLQEVDHTTRARILESVRAAFDPFVFGTDVRFTAACWIVGTRA